MTEMNGKDNAKDFWCSLCKNKSNTQHSTTVNTQIPFDKIMHDLLKQVKKKFIVELDFDGKSPMQWEMLRSFEDIRKTNHTEQDF